MDSPILTETNSESSKTNAFSVVRFCDEPFQGLGLFSIHYLDLRPLPHVLHGLTEDAVAHELEKVFLKLVLGNLPGLPVAGDVFF